ncbi:ubiquinol-cytochrome C chaperone family protein [Pseudemcibacter aquimaris]|nr:ubiquinol-cytochrome C chaperone family protein [Pseudemcibacter aquimaris]
MDGRFDLMALHMAIVIEKLNNSENQEDVLKLKQALQEIMFDNLDLTMREIGVGDMGVGKKVKAMAEAFYGRMKAYKEHLNSNNKAEMTAALTRNLYRDRNVDGKSVDAMVAYVFEQYSHVLNQDAQKVFSGEINFFVPDDE